MLLLREEGPTTGAAERSAAEAIRACAEAVVKMAALAGRAVSVELVEERIKEIQIERAERYTRRIES